MLILIDAAYGTTALNPNNIVTIEDFTDGTCYIYMNDGRKILMNCRTNQTYKMINRLIEVQKRGKTYELN